MTVGGGGMDPDLGHGQKIPLSPPGGRGAGGLVRSKKWALVRLAQDAGHCAPDLALALVLNPFVTTT